MTADLHTLLADLDKLHIRLRVDGGRLRYTAPEGMLTPALRARLQAHKSELIDLFGKHRSTEPVRFCPPSFAQRRFWKLQQLNPTEAFYNVPFVFRLCGELDVDILRRSFNEIARRHEVLRTTLRQIDGELMQAIAPAGEIGMTVTSLRTCQPEDQPAATGELLLSDMQRPFDLAHEPGFRVLLLDLDSAGFVMQLCFHNTVYDQSSLMVLLDELSAHYGALTKGEKAALAPPAQYTEYVRWQEALLASGMEDRLEYWRDWFARGEPPAWTWTSAKPAPEIPGFHTHIPWQRCSPELTRQLKASSQSNGVTTYLTLLTAYAMILSRYTGCSDLTIGTTYSNRHQWQFQSLIGATIDVPALRIDMTDNPGLGTLMARVRDVVAHALTHQDVPFERIVPDLKLAKPPRIPLFRVVYTHFAETPHNRLKLPGITVTYEEDLINEISRPDVYLVMWENQTEAGPALTGYWMHKRDVFTEETAERMNREWGALLEAMVRRPDATVEQLLGSGEIETGH